MDPIKKIPISPSDLNNLYGHNDLEGFAKFVGIDYDTLLQINQKNAQVMKEQQKSSD